MAPFVGATDEENGGQPVRAAGKTHMAAKRLIVALKV